MVKPSGKPDETVPEQEAAFAARARELLVESVDHLDGHTRSRLTQARHAALAHVATRIRSPYERWLLPAGGVAALLLAGFLWFNGQSVSPDLQAASPAIDDLELVAEAESFELLEELEFYAWLESEAVLPATSEGTG